jgi:hypothetical protein
VSGSDSAVSGMLLHQWAWTVVPELFLSPGWVRVGKPDPAAVSEAHHTRTA